ncbi:MAG TPA: salicylate synthase [Pseudonocardiaceae bacterium]|nr:salicylate synthase [Pseudonocardiaceae bacterium]
MTILPGYFREHIDATSDPLLLGAELARNADRPFVLYERDKQWSFGSGAIFELVMYQHEIRVRSSSDRLTVPTGDNPLQRVAELLSDIPIAGWRAYGWAGFELSYLLHDLPDAVGTAPLLHLIVPAREVLLDAEIAELRAVRKADLTVLRAALDKSPPAPARSPFELDISGVDADGYRRMVVAAVAEIRRRRLQKVILSRVIPVPGNIDLVSTYQAGRRGNTPVRSFLLDLGTQRSAGFSPETVVEISADGTVSTQPLAGTRALSGDPAVDLTLRAELLGDPKEIFEHAISVQVAQDELRAVCDAGSVRVTDFMAVEHRGSVQHLSSRVSGRLEPGRNAWHAFTELFPAVTVSGIPKAVACEVIRRYESQPRDLYSGAVFVVDADGALDAALVLRTVFQQSGRTWLRAGAGIVEQSTPDRELEETCEKLRSISRFLVPAGAARDDHAAIAATPCA